MNRLKYIIALLLFASPLTALAHGEEVLVTVFLEFLTVVILVIGLFTIKLNKKGKFVIGGIYLMTIILTSILTNLLPYRQNQTLINFLVVVVPLTIGIASYIGLKDKFHK